MKKVINKVILNLCLMVVFCVSFIIGTSSVKAANKRVVGIYRGDFVKGIAYTGTMTLASNGYTSEMYEDISLQSFLYELMRSDVIFIHTHGAPGLFTFTSSSRITGNEILSKTVDAKVKLFYLSACQSGKKSTTNGNVGTALLEKGVTSVVAFQENISAGSDTDGIHRFNSLVVYRLTKGDILQTALSTALSQLFAESGGYYGADSYIIYGDSSLIL